MGGIFLPWVKGLKGISNSHKIKTVRNNRNINVTGTVKKPVKFDNLVVLNVLYVGGGFLPPGWWSFPPWVVVFPKRGNACLFCGELLPFGHSEKEERENCSALSTLQLVKKHAPRWCYPEY